MTSDLPVPRLAVLIDAENVSHRLAPRIFALIEPLGFAPVRAVYGNFAGPAGSWAPEAARYALEPRHVFPATKGKNTADIALTIDAMDLMRDGQTNGFCIVSSDGDFAGLARRIRAEGCIVYGLGCTGTPDRCRVAYTKFHLLEPDEAGATASDHRAMPAIDAAIQECRERDGWYILSDFGNRARKAALTPEAYGVPTFGELLRATKRFTVEHNRRFRRVPGLRVVGGQ